jgi:hypothetical protein
VLAAVKMAFSPAFGRMTNSSKVLLLRVMKIDAGIVNYDKNSSCTQNYPVCVFPNVSESAILKHY